VTYFYITENNAISEKEWQNHACELLFMQEKVRPKICNC